MSIEQVFTSTSGGTRTPNLPIRSQENHLGTELPTVLDQLANTEASFDSVVVAVSRSVNQFVEDLESND